MPPRSRRRAPGRPAGTSASERRRAPLRTAPTTGRYARTWAATPPAVRTAPTVRAEGALRATCRSATTAPARRRAHPRPRQQVEPILRPAGRPTRSTSAGSRSAEGPASAARQPGRPPRHLLSSPARSSTGSAAGPPWWAGRSRAVPPQGAPRRDVRRSAARQATIRLAMAPPAAASAPGWDVRRPAPRGVRFPQPCAGSPGGWCRSALRRPRGRSGDRSTLTERPRSPVAASAAPSCPGEDLSGRAGCRGSCGANAWPARCRARDREPGRAPLRRAGRPVRRTGRAGCAARDETAGSRRR